MTNKWLKEKIKFPDRNIAGPVFGQLSKNKSLAVTINWNEFNYRSFVAS